ncbi:putative GNAT domain, acyl-CoA N-acyltransferase [Septoria linicola]|nr:putative GNAT domain, acyl-CoA N-acyltransferase [Septoria linicola]
MITFRLARDDEDEVLARLLYNAFRLNWGTNWEHDLSTPLPPVPTLPQSDESIVGPASSRLALWRATLPLTRRLGGDINVAIPPGTNSPAAVVCYLPPGVRPRYLSLLLSGWISAFLRLGLKTAYRFREDFELGERLWPPVLKPLGERYDTGAYVLVVGTNPEHAGHGYAGRLLQWRLERHDRECPKVPVYLETATDHAQRVYERLGFEEMVRKRVMLPSVDERGCKLDLSIKTDQPDGADKPYFALRCVRYAP